ncbi:MAG: hypothetical protein ABSH49_32465 [Bryobacteraceae bacterium]|jgi:hypothetical protein
MSLYDLQRLIESPTGTLPVDTVPTIDRLLFPTERDPGDPAAEPFRCDAFVAELASAGEASLLKNASGDLRIPGQGEHHSGVKPNSVPG